MLKNRALANKGLDFIVYLKIWRTWRSLQSSFAVTHDGTLNLRAHVHKLGAAAGIRTQITPLTWIKKIAERTLYRVTLL